MSGGIIEPSLNPDKDPADANWERQTTDVVNELQHSVNNLVIEEQEKTVFIYADTANAATNTQNYTPIFAEGQDTGLFVAIYNYTGALPTLPIREGITFGPYTPNPVDVTIYQYRRSSTRPNNAGTVVYNTSTGAWASTGGQQPWQKEIPAQDNIPTWVCFAIISKADGPGAIPKTWSNPALLYSRERSSGVVWHTVRLPTSSPPSTPSATDCNFTTGILSGLTTNWQQTPPTVDMGGTKPDGTPFTISDLYWQSNFIAELHPGSSTATVTFSTPTSYIPIGTNLQSDNYQSGSAGWQIVRNTGNAEFNNITARGNIEATSFNGTLNLGNLPQVSIESTSTDNTQRLLPANQGLNSIYTLTSTGTTFHTRPARTVMGTQIQTSCSITANLDDLDLINFIVNIEGTLAFANVASGFPQVTAFGGVRYLIRTLGGSFGGGNAVQLQPTDSQLETFDLSTGFLRFPYTLSETNAVDVSSHTGNVTFLVDLRQFNGIALTGTGTGTYSRTVNMTSFTFADLPVFKVSMLALGFKK